MADVADPSIVLFKPTLSNYAQVLDDADFTKYYLNSIIVASTATILGIAIGIPAGYSLARFNFPKKENFSFFILSTRFAPPVMALLPYFILFQYVGLYDTLTSLIIMYMTITLPFVVWMSRGYFEEIPKDMEEAAMVDGCTRLSAIWRITLPLIKPGLVATAIISVIFCWNEFLFAVILTGTQSKTAPVQLFRWLGAHTVGGLHWGQLMASGLLIALPIIIFALITQKYLIRGLTLGAVKG
jgi:multiple sugar transport system permease protein